MERKYWREKWHIHEFCNRHWKKRSEGNAIGNWCRIKRDCRCIIHLTKTAEICIINLKSIWMFQSLLSFISSNIRINSKNITREDLKLIWRLNFIRIYFYVTSWTNVLNTTEFIKKFSMLRIIFSLTYLAKLLHIM